MTRSHTASGIGRLFVGTLLAVAMSATAAPVETPATRAGGPLVLEGLDAAGRLVLMINKSQVINTTRAYKRLSVAQPDIADVNAVSSTSFLVTAKKGGATQLVVWDEAGKSQSLELVVEVDIKGIESQLRAVFPDAKIQVIVTEGMVVLRGRVPTLTMAEQAAQLAAGGGKVLNLLEISGQQQVMLRVRFAEVSRSAITALGINGGFVAGQGFGGSNIGGVNPTSLIPPAGTGVGNTPAFQGFGLPARTITPNVTLYGGGQIGSVYVEAFMAALRQNNLMRVLAEPNLIATSGQEANFLAGGEFPIPVVQGGGTAANASISIEFREFGVRLRFVPVVMGNGRIKLRVAPEVSDLDFSTAVRFSGFVVPGLTSRKVETTVELGDGQSFAVAGLLSSRVVGSKESTPILGDLPILGALFRSVRYERRETELVVFVTPQIVSPLNPDQVKPLPGEFWRFPTESELLLMRDLGGPAKGPSTAPSGGPMYYGNHGFMPATQPAK